jgi:hypothetical protein
MVKDTTTESPNTRPDPGSNPLARDKVRQAVPSLLFTQFGEITEDAGLGK